ncbi:MAG: hypothetical protein ACHQ15_08865, partial [Candidatus Limnocylindrales bacterium]
MPRAGSLAVGACVAALVLAGSASPWLALAAFGVAGGAALGAAWLRRRGGAILATGACLVALRVVAG